MESTRPAVQVAEQLESLLEIRQRWTGQTVAFVPTMGALHEGHFSLIRQARALADRVVVSIYVNPLQFGPSEDLSRYPRTLAADLAACGELGVDLVFTPNDAQMYPNGREGGTHVVPPVALTEQLCGLSRPGHFEGVATVVLKLLNLVRPDVACFGEKDAQQLAVIRHMVADFSLPVRIVGCQTVREADGLALSSRNKYFKTAQERQAALILSQTLAEVARRFDGSAQQEAAPVLEEALSTVLSQPEFATEAVASLFRLDYLTAVERETFTPTRYLTSTSKVLMAAYIGAVRLIDNRDLA